DGPPEGLVVLHTCAPCVLAMLVAQRASTLLHERDGAAIAHRVPRSCSCASLVFDGVSPLLLPTLAALSACTTLVGRGHPSMSSVAHDPSARSCLACSCPPYSSCVRHLRRRPLRQRPGSMLRTREYRALRRDDPDKTTVFS